MARFYYFPSPYPDELIGSVVQRACHHRATSFKRLALQLSGNKKSYLSFSMSSLLVHIARATNIEPEKLLWEHTFFPYITRFMSATETTRLATSLLTEHKAGNAALTQAGLLGFSGHRFCLDCLRNDTTAYGEPYWHRTHNLPMVEFCNQHHQWLYVEKPSYKRRAPSNSAAQPFPSSASAGLIQPSTFVDLAGAICTVSEACLVEKARREPEEWYRDYRDEVFAKGAKKHGTGLVSQNWAQVFDRLFGAPFLQRAQLTMRSGRVSWVALMLREQPCIPFIALKHVVMRVFLDRVGRLDERPEEIPSWKRPGPVSRDYAALDVAFVAIITDAIHKLERTGCRIQISKMLVELGIWSTYRHAREKLPSTVALLRHFHERTQKNKATPSNHK